MHFSTTLLALLPILTPLISAVPAAATSTVRVQLNGLDELAEQREITIGVLTSFAGPFTDGFIEDLEGHTGVTCQAFTDTAGKDKVGGKFGIGDVEFDGGNAVNVETVKCY